MKLAYLGISLCLLASTAAEAAEGEPADMVRPSEAIRHVGEFAMVCGVIASARWLHNSRGGPTYLNFDKPYPDQDFTVVIWGKDRGEFAAAPETLTGYKACAYGKIESYKGKAQIVARRQEQLNYTAPGNGR